MPCYLRRIWPLTVLPACVLLIVAGCQAPATPTPSRAASAAAKGICHVHGLTMQHVAVPIGYGFRRWGPYGPGALQESQFPFAQWSVIQRNETTPDAATTETVWSCPACQDAKRFWIQQHRDDPWAKFESSIPRL